MQLRIAICDDIPAHSEHLAQMLASEGLALAERIRTFDTAQALLAAMERGIAFDIVFLDVELGNESGIAVAQRMNGSAPGTQIIFVTANIVNAIDVGEANHIYFLVKPVNAQKLHSAMERAMQPLFMNADKRLRLSLLGGSDAILSSGQIVYCERVKRTTTIVCTDAAYYTTEKLDYFENALPERLFVRSHNSFLVNLLHVAKADRFTVCMDTGATLPVSNQRRNAFREALAAFVSKA